MVAMLDRRRHSRSRIDWPVSVYHPRLGMFINARSVDVSHSGARISLPVAVPIRPGQVVELNFPRTTTLAKLAGCYSRIKTAVVVRVESEEASAPADDALCVGAPLPGVPASDMSGLGAPCVAGGMPLPGSPQAMQAVWGQLAAPAKHPLKPPRPRRQTVAVHFDRHALSLLK